MTYPTSPANITDFVWFIQNEMRVPAEALAANPVTQADVITAWAVACATVNTLINVHSPIYYNLAMYNFAADYLFQNCVDQECSTYWLDERKKWRTSAFTAGVVAGTADLTTSATIEVPDNLKDLSLFDLQQLKTPYGRAYMAIAQKFGDLWGAS